MRKSPKDWNSIKTELLLVEKAIFGKIAFTEKEFKTFRNTNAYNLIIYSSGKIIGYLMSQKLSNSGVHNGMRDKDKIFYLESVGLLEQYRGKGIGKEVFESYLAYGKKLRCKSYLLDTREKSMIGLAKHYGFKSIGYNKLHFWNGKKWSGAWIMRKDI
jgi:GNAT superfamily N-acetyltransferase